MKKFSKRMLAIRNSISVTKKYSILDGLQLLKVTQKTNFIESVDVAINLGINTRKSDQNVRSNVVMPYGIGKKFRFAIFTNTNNINDIDLIKKEGVDLIGSEDLYDRIKSDGCNDIDIVIASPDVMNIVGKLGPILGPRGLMPNPKMGTVSKNILESIKNIKSGQVQYKNDKNGIIHVTIGKINFDLVHLQKNLEALMISVKKIKPIHCKGTYIKKIFLSTTMGGSILIDKNNFDFIL